MYATGVLSDEGHEARDAVVVYAALHRFGIVVEPDPDDPLWMGT